MNLELHPLSTLFPRMADAEFAALVADIRAHGLRDAIVTYQGMVLDGGHRQKACAIADVQPRYLEFSGGDPVAFVFSKNLRRRHLTSGQEAAIVALATDWTKAQGVGRPQSGSSAALGESGNAAGLPESGNSAGLSRVADRAAQSGASDRTQRMADAVAKADPELAKQVAQGTVSLADALAKVKGTTVATPRDKPTSGKGTTKKADPADADRPSAADLLDEQEREIHALQATVKSMEADDSKAEVLKWKRVADAAQRGQSEAMDRAAKAVQREAWTMRQLARCGKAVGESDPEKIAAAVEAVARTVRGKVAA